MIFVSSAIILKQIEVRDRERVYVLLTEKFGKIRGFFLENPKQGFYDIGSKVEVLIDRKGEINRIKSIKVQSQISREGFTYSDLEGFLLLLKFCDQQIPEGGGESGFYSDLCEIIDQGSTPETFRYYCQLFELRGLSALQLRSPGKHDDPLLIKLEHIARDNSVVALAKIQGIPDATLNTIHLNFLKHQTGQ